MEQLKAANKASKTGLRAKIGVAAERIIPHQSGRMFEERLCWCSQLHMCTDVVSTQACCASLRVVKTFNKLSITHLISNILKKSSTVSQVCDWPKVAQYLQGQMLQPV